MAIIWSPRSLHDVESIRDYVAQDSPRVADLVVRRIIKAVERLETFQESGRKVPERNDPGIREVISAPYRIVYRMRGGN
jgi:toxin ParE1/3/4